MHIDCKKKINIKIKNKNLLVINYNNLDYKQIKIFIKLEIIGEEDKKKKLYLFFKKI